RTTGRGAGSAGAAAPARSASPEMAAFLEASGVTKRFGGLVALNRVNFELAEGRIASIIGPNGAGKTTFFNVFTGLYVPEEGSVTFRATSLTGLPPHHTPPLP